MGTLFGEGQELSFCYLGNQIPALVFSKCALLHCFEFSNRQRVHLIKKEGVALSRR